MPDPAPDPTTSRRRGADHDDDHHDGGGMGYGRFLAMIATSVVVMFGIKYLTTYQASHVWFSETRSYMALVMGGAMAIIMLLFMLGMYRDKRMNAAIVVGALVLMAGSLFLVRSQATIGDRSYMKAMIPHHSIAVLTSERSQIEDVRVRELADEIIKAQRKEIKEMEWLIADIEANGVAATAEEAEGRPVPTFEGELNPGD